MFVKGGCCENLASAIEKMAVNALLRFLSLCVFFFFAPSNFFVWRLKKLAQEPKGWRKGPE